MIAIINILSIFNLFALAFLIGLRKQNIFANRVLAITLVCSATDFVINFLSYLSLLDDFYYLGFLNFSFLWAPLVTAYVFLMLDEKWKFKPKHLVHIIPQLLSWAYWVYIVFMGKEEKEILFTNRTNGIYSWQSEALQLIVLFQTMGYLAYSAYLINQRQKSKVQNYISPIRLRWVKQFVYVLSGLIFFLIGFTFFVKPVTIDYIIAPILYGISNIFLVYKSLNSSGIFTDVSVEELKVLKERYTGSNLKPEQIADYKSVLLNYLQKEEPYTDPELTLNDLSAKTDIQVHQLSQIINQEFGKNFFDLINSYRIEKAKALMKDSNTAKLTLEAIGLQSGFGSASSFYRSFKKQTGITPNAFLKAQSVKKQG